MDDTGTPPLEKLRQRPDLWAIGAIAVVGLSVRVRGLEDWWINPDEGIYYALATSPSWSHFWEQVAANYDKVG